MVARHELIVFPSRALVQAHRTVTAQLAPHGVAFGTNALAIQEFEQWLMEGVLGPQARVLTDFEERCRLRALMATEPLKSAYGEQLVGTPGFIPTLQRTIHAHQQLGPSPNRLLTPLDRLLFTWEQDLVQAELWSRLTALREVVSRLQGGSDIPPWLKNCSRVVFKHSFELSPLQTTLIEALSTRLTGLVEVVIEIPYQDSNSGYFRHSARVLSQFEKTGDRLQTTVLPTDDSEEPGVGRELLACLLQQRPCTEVSWSSISLHQSTTPTRERLTLAEQVHAWLAEGIAPDQIVIAMRHLDHEAHQLRQSLLDSSLQVQAIPQPALSASPLLRWFTTLLSLSYRPWHPQILTDVLSSSYASDLHGLGSNAISRGLTWLMPYAYSSHQELIDSLEQNAGGDAQVCARALRVLAEQLDALSTPQTLTDFVQLTRQLMAHCHLHRNLPLPARTAQDLRALIGAEDSVSIELGMAMGREDLGLNALEQVLGNLELVGTRLSATLLPKEYWQILTDGLRSQNVYPPGPRSGAIKLIAVRDLVGTRADAIAIPHLVDGRFPATKRNEAILSGSEESDALEYQSHYEKEALLFALSISAARSRLALSYSVYDTSGREAMPALFMQECLLAARTAGQADCIQTHPDEPVPPPDRAFGPDRLGRAMVHAIAPAHPGQTPADIAAAAIPIPQATPSEVASALHRVVIERQRLAHAYAKGSLFNTPYTGQLTGVSIAIPGSKERPLSASQLETAARCPFQDFVGRVLRLGTKPLPQIDVDPRDDGQLAHECFEAAMLAIIAHSPGPYRAENAESACATALDAINHRLEQEQHRQLLPPGLYNYRAEHLRRRLLLLIENMYRQDEAFEPKGVEVAFGPEGSWPPLEYRHPDLDTPIWLQGRIDLLEQQGDALRAADLKRKGTDKLRDALKPNVLGQTSLQLPIYAAACGVHSLSAAGDARFLSLKNGKAMPSLRVHVQSPAWKGDDRSADDVLALALPDGTPTPLGDGISRLAAEMRSNNYALKPAEGACLRCDFAALCRVPSLDIPDVS